MKTRPQSSAFAHASSQKTNKSKIFIRNGCKWTDGEDRILEELYVNKRKLQNSDYKKLSTYLHRSIDAIQIRLVRKHIYPKKISNELSAPHVKYNDILQKYSNRYDIPVDDLDKYLKYADSRLKVRRTLFPDTDSDDSSHSSNSSDSSNSESSYVPSECSESTDSDDLEDNYTESVDPRYQEILEYLEKIDRKLDLLLFKRKKSDRRTRK